MPTARRQAPTRTKPRPTGRATTRTRAPRGLEHRILLTAALCLLAAGAVMVYSASSAKTLLQGQGDGSTYLVRYVAYGAVGLVLLRLLSRHGLTLLWRITPVLLVVSLAGVIATRVPGIGVEVNGARRWLGAGPLQFQPSELLKLALVLYSARLLAARPDRVRTLRAAASPLLLVAGISCLLVATQPDLGTALVIAFTLGALLVAAGMPARHLLVMGAVAIVLVSLFAILEPYRRARLTSFLDPWSHPGTSGFQAVQAQIAVGSGGLFGLGPGQSVQKVFYLPEAHTDFILAVIGEELGVAGVSVLLALYGMIAYAGLRAAKAAKDRFGMLLAAGLTSLILSQAMLNVFAVLGLAPLTGVPLPLVSYGTSSLLVTLAAMGLLLNVAAGGRVRAGPARRVDATGAQPRRWGNGGHASADDRHRRGRDGRARGAGAGGRRRAAG
jgi:cell division protein FtsW